MSGNKFSLLAMLPLLCLQVSARINLPGIISDHMVLQRDMPARLWGWATPGSVITLRFKGKIHQSTTAEDGKWLVKLPAGPAGGSFELEIEGDSSLISILDILVGDVWVASGQSNIEYGIQTDRDGKEAISQATNSMIRLFFVPWVTSLTEKENTASVTGLNGQWVVCSPKTMAENWAWHGFSAVGYFFAQMIRKNYPKLPLGMIGAYKGGTPAQAWVSINGLEQEETLHHYVDEHKKILKAYKQSEGTAGKTSDGGFGAPGNLFNGMIAPLIHFPVKGVIWESAR
jgi:sialate O-acetylesterase